ncbi:MAG: hypothetical protein E6767_04280 [Dysgonomonas sp.]|nr:hypothetical protein [Dysgonomonas sp.]
MRTDKLIFINKSLATSILALGMIHEIATFTPFIEDGFSCLSDDYKGVALVFSLACGSLLMLSGLLLFLFMSKIKEITYLFKPAFIVIVFVLLNGILSVIFMFDNPFAWISLFLSLSMVYTVYRLRRNLIII